MHPNTIFTKNKNILGKGAQPSSRPIPGGEGTVPEGTLLPTPHRLSAPLPVDLGYARGLLLAAKSRRQYSLSLVG